MKHYFSAEASTIHQIQCSRKILFHFWLSFFSIKNNIIYVVRISNFMPIIKRQRVEHFRMCPNNQKISNKSSILIVNFNFENRNALGGAININHGTGVIKRNFIRAFNIRIMWDLFFFVVAVCLFVFIFLFFFYLFR